MLRTFIMANLRKSVYANSTRNLVLARQFLRLRLLDFIRSEGQADLNFRGSRTLVGSLRTLYRSIDKGLYSVNLMIYDSLLPQVC
jgi:hypothetical protein